MSKSVAAENQQRRRRAFVRSDATHALRRVIEEDGYTLLAYDAKRGSLTIRHEMFGQWTLRLGITPATPEEVERER